MNPIIENLTDDKSLVIVAVLILGLALILKVENPDILPIITGLFGVAVGKVGSKP